MEVQKKKNQLSSRKMYKDYLITEIIIYIYMYS